MIARCLACVGAGAVGVVIPATAASASPGSLGGKTASTAVSGASPATTPVSCATVADTEGLIGTWGIGAKATNVLPDAATCAQDFQSVTPSTLVSGAINQLTDAESYYYWIDEGAYPTPSAVSTVTSELTSAASAVDREVRALRNSPAAGNLVSAEQWIAYSAYSIDTHYLDSIDNGTQAGALAMNLVEQALSAGSQAYVTGHYASATQSFLGFLPFDYVLAPPASYCGPYCGLS